MSNDWSARSVPAVLRGRGSAGGALLRAAEAELAAEAAELLLLVARQRAEELGDAGHVVREGLLDRPLPRRGEVHHLHAAVGVVPLPPHPAAPLEVVDD